MPPRPRTTLPRRDDVALASDQPELSYLDVADLRADGGTQMRASLNAETVSEYAAVMQEHDGWGPFPAVVAYYDGQAYWLADGFHRRSALLIAIEAAGTERPIEDKRIPTRVIPGDRRSAILHAVAANANHGLRRTNADKRRSVETLLRDAEWREWSDAEIARRCAVDPKTVGTIRRDLASTREIPESTARKAADGRVLDTSRIGSNQPDRVIKTRAEAKSEPMPAPPPEATPPPLPDPPDRLAELRAAAKAKRMELAHLRELYATVLDTLADYERLTGMFGHSSPLRKTLRPMLETVEKNLGLQPTEKQ